MPSRTRHGHPSIGRAVATAVAALLVALASPSVALGHGVDLSFRPSEGIEVTAFYDGGGPMDGAQVAVFAPGEPAEPVLTGVCDSEGRFFFVPDPAKPGIWEVQVRQAGHGGLLRVEVASEGVVSQQASSFTGVQKLVMAAAVTWGLIGTALYFRRKKV